MANITILLRHSGSWVSEIEYENYRIDGILLRDNANYNNLVDGISAQLGIDCTRKIMEIKYKMEGNLTPMEIRNEMGMRFFMELKRRQTNCGMYPLCITTKDHNFGCGINGEIAFEPDTSIVQVGGDDMNVSGVVLQEIRSVDALCILDMNSDNVIGDCNQKFVQVKQLYKDKKTIVAVMQKYAIDNRFQYKVARSDKKSYFLRCMSEECQWVFKASCLNDTTIFRVRCFNNDHTCPLKEKVMSQRQATIGLIAGIVAPKYENHKRKHTPKDIQEDVKRDLGVDINYMKAWRSKERAIKMLRGGPTEGYIKMPSYLYMLYTVYPNSYIRMHKSTDNEFMYLFIALYPFIKGFEHCRPIVVVDGAHLKGAYKGTFVSASTLDGAGCILPLAYGVIDSENDNSWTWFFEHFRGAFGERVNMCVVSDRHESIIKAVSRVYPSVPHYACVWHLWQNVCKYYKKSKNTLSDVFYAMAKAYRQEDFDEMMKKVEDMDHRVKDYLMLAGYEKWARVYAPVNRGRMMTSNIAECINSCLVEARELPIIDFLEQVRILFGDWNCRNREKATYTFTTLGRKFQEMLVVNEAKSSRMTVRPSSESLYGVDDNGRRYIVCLISKTCSCGRFQLDEIPCSHAIAVLRKKNITEFEPYCSKYYKPSTLISTYEIPIGPLPDEEDWNIPDSVLNEVVFPPKYKRPPGRPKKSRHKNMSEKISSSTNCCGQCGQEGHNRRTCSYFPMKR